MIVKPRLRFEYGAEIEAVMAGRDPEGATGVHAIASIPSDGLFVRCVVVSPASQEGRNVTLWIEGEAVALMLLELRNHARELRR